MSKFLRGLGKTRFKGEPTDLLVIGLGNPGSEFVGTRHNVGAEVIDELVERHGSRLRKTKSRALAAGIVLRGKRVVVAFPQTFMNNSGEAVRSLARSYGVLEPQHIVVIHDELDLDPGRLRLKSGGGLAGHNGLRSITQHLGTTDYLRLRVGIGRPPGSQSGSNYVLRVPGKADREVLQVAVSEAADAIERLVVDGPEATMSIVNRRKPRDS